MYFWYPVELYAFITYSYSVNCRYISQIVLFCYQFCIYFLHDLHVHINNTTINIIWCRSIGTVNDNAENTVKSFLKCRIFAIAKLNILDEWMCFLVPDETGNAASIKMESL